MGITKYFRIKEDEEIRNRPIFLGFNSPILKAESVEGEENVVYTKSIGQFSDYTDKRFLLVSDEFKAVLKMYHTDYIYKIVIIQVEGEESQRVYWNVEMPDECRCLAAATTFKRDGMFDKIVINEQEAHGLAMFCMANKFRNYYVVRLDLAESLLRRSLVGFVLEELDHE